MNITTGEKNLQIIGILLKTLANPSMLVYHSCDGIECPAMHTVQTTGNIILINPCCKPLQVSNDLIQS